MSHRRTWDAPQSTRVRRMLSRLERLRYRLVYIGRLRRFKTVRPDIRGYRLTRQMVREVRSYWARYGVNYVNPNWYKVFGALTGKFDPRFIPEDTFRVELENWLSPKAFAPAYADKNMLDKRFPDVVKPETVLRSIHGKYYDGSYRAVTRDAAAGMLASLSGDFIVKPAVEGAGGGQNVNLIHIDGGRIETEGVCIDLSGIEHPYGTDFLVQRKVVQHSSMAVYYDRSFNTCRVITLRLDDQHKVIAATFRMGNGSYVDNGCAGGLLCGVEVTTGQLTPYALDVDFRQYEKHPISGQVFAGQRIERFDKMKQLALSVHPQLTYFDMASFDIGLRADGEPCLIEVNLFGQGIEPHQALKGSPIFGEDTDRVLEIVANRRNRRWN